MSKRKKILKLKKRVAELELELAVEKLIMEKFPTPKDREENFFVIKSLRS